MSDEHVHKPEVIIPGAEKGDDVDALLDLIAWLMDRAVTIPGTKIKLGLDAILGLLPIGGDALAGIVQTGVVLTAVARYRVPRAVVARMVANVLLDVAVGAIPLLGDAFDVYFKANTRNVALLREAQALQRQGLPMPAAPSRRYLILLAVGLGVALLALVLGFIAIATWVVRLVWRAGT
jgi:Domain of unknown function (DUF4112)